MEAGVRRLRYDADGARVQSVMDGETTVFIGSHYEIANPGTNQVATKYYLAGGVRVAIRKGEVLSYLLADHIGSTSLSTDASGNRTSELRYKAFGETRFSYGTMPTRYTFTGQFSYADDPSTAGVAEGFGLYYFNARWMDPSLGRFAQPDSIVPTQTQGTQAWDRYAFVNNNPVRYNDPTGHQVAEDKGGSKGHSEPVCMDPAASNYRAYGSCTYPAPKTSAKGGLCFGWGPQVSHTIAGFFSDDKGVIGGKSASLKYSAGVDILVYDNYTNIIISEDYSFSGTAPENDVDSSASSTLIVTMQNGDESMFSLGSFQPDVSDDLTRRTSTISVPSQPRYLEIGLKLILGNEIFSPTPGHILNNVWVYIYSIGPPQYFFSVPD
jgi:RHS repeat-associated protein